MSCNNIFCKNDKFNPFITFLSKAQRSKLLMRRVLLLLALASSVLVLAGGETNGICVSWHVSPLMALIASCLRHCPSKWGRQLTHISQSRSALLGGTKHLPRRSLLEESPNIRNNLTYFSLFPSFNWTIKDAWNENIVKMLYMHLQIAVLFAHHV